MYNMDEKALRKHWILVHIEIWPCIHNKIYPSEVGVEPKRLLFAIKEEIVLGAVDDLLYTWSAV